MAASAAATECAAFDALAAAYLNGLVAVLGRDRTEDDWGSCVPCFNAKAESPRELLGDSASRH